MPFNPLISICIPTFNRCEKVFKLVNDLLSYQGDEIEIIVLDNCSTDNTSQLLNNITDTRFFFIENKENIGGTLNLLKAITLAHGTYAFLCLDKDNINCKNIKDLVNRLNTDLGVVFGHCALNLKEQTHDIIYDKGFSSISNMAYLSEHPSGTFYNTNDFKNLNILKKIFQEKEKFSFYVDLINAEMSLIGKSRLVNLPLFYTETKDDCAQTPSHTYSKKDLFFSPAYRLIEYKLYIKSLCGLNLEEDELLILIRKLYNKGITNATFVYKHLMADTSVCMHYGVATRKIGFIELCKINFQFSINFLMQKLPISYRDKLHIFFGEQKSFYSKTLRSFRNLN